MADLNYQNPNDARRETWTQRRLALFGPSRADVWSKLAEEIGGRFEPGGFWRGREKVTATVGPWTVTLDHHVVSNGETSTSYTRLRAPYVNADNFRFLIFRRHLFSPLAELMGFQDVEVGHPEFDDAFIIRGSSSYKLCQLFANPRLRQLLSAQPRVRFEVRDDEGFFRQRFPDGVDMLQFMAVGVIKDIDRLKGLFDLFAETLHTLCHIGSAYENDPGIALS